MGREEINAWGNYEQTARNARSLEVRNRFAGGGVASASRHRTLAATSALRRHSGSERQLITSTHRSRYATARIATASLHRSVHLRDLEEGGPQTTQTSTVAQRRPQKLASPKLLPHSVHGSNRLILPHSLHGTTPYSFSASTNTNAEDQDKPREVPEILPVPSEDEEVETLDSQEESPVEDQECPAATEEKLPVSLDEELRSTLYDIFSVYFDDAFFDDEDLRMERKALESSSSLWASIFFMQGTMPWLQDSIKSQRWICPSLWIFVELCLRGISQVYFQSNPFTGLMILIGLFVQSASVAVHGVIAVVSGNLLALLLGFDKGLIEAGLFGYNAVLVGLAVGTFSPEPFGAAVLVASVLFGGFSSIVFVSLGKILVPYKSPPLTLPFNIATILFFLAVPEMFRVNYGSVRDPSLPNYSYTPQDNTVDKITARAFFAGMIRGIGQVYLCDNIASGVLVLAGIVVCSRIAALAALVGALLGPVVAMITGASAGAVEQGLYGFNCSLTLTGMFMFYAPSYGTVVFAALAGIMTVIGQQAMATLLLPYGLPFLTLPFCMVALPFIILQGTTTLVVAVPLASITIPEVHRKTVKMLTDGFHMLKDALDESYGKRNDRLSFAGKHMKRSMERMSSAFTLDQPPSVTKLCDFSCSRQKDQDPEVALVREQGTTIFGALVMKGDDTGELTAERFRSALQEVGLDDTDGLHFARHVFDLMDFDRSQTIDQREFVALCVVSTALRDIRKKITEFFHFVDADESGACDIDELNSALAYLGKSGLSDEECEALNRNIALTEDGEFLIGDLACFVIVEKIRAMVDDIQS